MQKVAYLTMDDLSEFVSDADLSFEPLRSLGWEPELVSWRDTEANWDQYAAVYLCTPWDYQDEPDAFMRVLESIDASRALLVNPLELVRWNLDKTYLKDLQTRGVPVVPSRWFERFDINELLACFAAFESDTIVIKPQVGANSDHISVLRQPMPPEKATELAATFATRPFFVQPFIASVQSDGEFSVFFFGGEYSHCIRKLPEAGDFRTQEEHGADIQPFNAPAALIDAAQQALTATKPAPTYARADFLLAGPDEYLMMELELIEPSLYFRTDAESAARFAAAMDSRLRQRDI